MPLPKRFAYKLSRLGCSAPKDFFTVEPRALLSFSCRATSLEKLPWDLAKTE
jgi:hypothetical protein